MCKNNKFHVPFTQFWPVVIIHITIAQYHNQETGIVTIQKPYSDFTSFMGVHVCVCAILSLVDVTSSTGQR